MIRGCRYRMVVLPQCPDTTFITDIDLTGVLRVERWLENPSIVAMFGQPDEMTRIYATLA